MGRPLLLDLFCGEGGCSAGYEATGGSGAGFDVEGVDLHPKPRYRWRFHQADALEFLAENWQRFDAIHASPPCKSETRLKNIHNSDHPDLLTPTLAALREIPRPWVVENVSDTAKLPGALMLCGAAFALGAFCVDGRWRPLKRHRLFESNVFLMGGGCACNGREPIGVYGHGGAKKTPGSRRGYQATVAEARDALVTPWMSQAGISQAIPPAYTELIGGQILDDMAERAAVRGAPPYYIGPAR